MKIYKTVKTKRSTYRYPVSVPDGKDGYRTVYNKICPGENGVTVADIKSLHYLDDKEVRLNNKNMHPTRTKEEIAEVKAFKEKFIVDFTNEFGYKPFKSDIDDAIKEIFPTNWNLSLDWEMENEGGKDKSRIALATSVEMEKENSEVDRLYEVMETMTDKQREVLKLVKLEEYSLTEVSKIIGTSIPNVKKHLDKAIKHIEKNYYKN